MKSSSDRLPRTQASVGALLLASLLLASACGDPPRPDPQAETRAQPAEQAQQAQPELRRFVFSDFLWELGGSEVAWLESNGTLELILFSEERERDGSISTHWHRHRTSVEQSVVRELATLIQAQSVMGLEDRYVDNGVSDGTTQDFAIDLGGQRKRIHCSNSFPPPIEALRRFVRERLVEPHREEVRRRPRLPDATPEALVERDPFGEREIVLPVCELRCCSAREQRQQGTVCCVCEEEEAGTAGLRAVADRLARQEIVRVERAHMSSDPAVRLHFEDYQVEAHEQPEAVTFLYRYHNPEAAFELWAGHGMHFLVTVSREGHTARLIQGE